MRLTCNLAPACLLFTLYCLLLPAVARGQEPDFSGTTDILNGQTHSTGDYELGRRRAPK